MGSKGLDVRGGLGGGEHGGPAATHRRQHVHVGQRGEGALRQQARGKVEERK